MRRLLVLIALIASLAWAQGTGTLEQKLEAAYQALEQGEYERAIPLFEDVVAEDYRNFSAHFGLGVAYLRSGRLKEALFEFRQLTQLYPNRYEAWYNLGVTLAELGDWQGAVDAFSRAIAIGLEKNLEPEKLRPAYLALAEAYRKLGNAESAAATLAQAYQKLPGDTEIALLLAESLIEVGRSDEAIPYLYDVLAKDRKNVGAVLLLADALADHGLYHRALKELDRALARTEDPKDRARLLYKKALVLAKSGADQKEVEALIKQAIALDPELWQAHYDLGRMRLAVGDAKGALEAFTQAARANPEDPKVLLGLAAAYDALGKPKEAYALAQKALEKAKGREKLEALFLLGKSAAQLGLYEQAVEALKQVVAARPSDADAWMWLGIAYYGLKDFGQAAQALERAAELDNRVEILEKLGAAYLAARRYADAEQVLSQVVKQDPSRAEAWYHLGWALKALGREAEAKRAWKKARELGYRPPKG